MKDVPGLRGLYLKRSVERRVEGGDLAQETCAMKKQNDHDA